MRKLVQKFQQGLAKAVDAAVTIRSSKDSLKTIEEKYHRPENCEFLVTPRVNPEIWRAIHKLGHTQDLALQEVQKSLATGLIPIVQLADKCVKSKGNLDPVETRSMLADSISLIGHAMLSLSHRRRYTTCGPIYMTDIGPFVGMKPLLLSSSLGRTAIKGSKSWVIQ